MSYTKDVVSKIMEIQFEIMAIVNYLLDNHKDYETNKYVSALAKGMELTKELDKLTEMVGN